MIDKIIEELGKELIGIEMELPKAVRIAKALKLIKEEMNNYIPKSRVEERINELEKENKSIKEMVKPTIEELEKIMDETGTKGIEIKPDGSIVSVTPNKEDRLEELQSLLPKQEAGE